MLTRFLTYFTFLFYLIIVTGCTSYSGYVETEKYVFYSNKDSACYEYYQTNFLRKISTIAMLVSYPENFDKLPDSKKMTLIDKSHRVLSEAIVYAEKNAPDFELYNVEVLSEIVKINKDILKSNKRFDGLLILFVTEKTSFTLLYHVDRDGMLEFRKSAVSPKNLFEMALGRKKQTHVGDIHSNSSEDARKAYQFLQIKWGKEAIKKFPILAEYEEDYTLPFPEYLRKSTLTPIENENDINHIRILADYDIHNNRLERGMETYRWLQQNKNVNCGDIINKIEFLLEQTDIGLKQKRLLERLKQKLSIK